MDTSELLDALFGSAPFFGGNTFGFQGSAPRHVFMIAAVARAVRQGAPIRILEIGSWTGSSALSFSQAITMFCPDGGRLLCVDPWQAFISSADIERGGYNGIYASMDAVARTDIAYHLFRHNTKAPPPGVQIDHIRGLSRDVLPTLEAGSFDMIYIDGSHYYADALADIRMSDSLLREGGILCGDDLELQMDQYDNANARKNIQYDYIRDPKSGVEFHPGVALAAGAFFKRRISAYAGFWVVRKADTRYEDVSLEGIPSAIPNHFGDVQRQQCAPFLKQN